MNKEKQPTHKMITNETKKEETKDNKQLAKEIDALEYIKTAINNLLNDKYNQLKGINQ